MTQMAHTARLCRATVHGLMAFAGALSDSLVPEYGIDSMRYALLAVVTVGWLWTAAHYWLGSRTLVRDLAAKDA